MPIELSRHQLGDRTIIQVSLPDRRLSSERAEAWCFQRDVELALYGSNTGALNRLLGRRGGMPVDVREMPARACADCARFFGQVLALIGSLLRSARVRP